MCAAGCGSLLSAFNWVKTIGLVQLEGNVKLC